MPAELQNKCALNEGTSLVTPLALGGEDLSSAPWGLGVEHRTGIFVVLSTEYQTFCGSSYRGMGGVIYCASRCLHGPSTYYLFSTVCRFCHFFRFSLLMFCICCKVRDRHTARCVEITKHKEQQRSCIFVQTRTQHKKRVPIVAGEMSQVLFSIITGIK